MKGKATTQSPKVTAFWDAPTGSWRYVFHDPATMKGAIVDPVWNFDPLSGATAVRDAQTLLDYVRDTGIDVEWVLDTHPHADHFSAGVWLQQQLGAKTGIREHVVKVQSLWKEIYNLGDDFATDGSQWDHLFADGDTFKIGNLEVQVMFSPGHTMASVSYVVGDAAFVHDTLMMPDSGTSRADFPGGSSAALYDSIMQIMALPDDTRLYVGHDYVPDRDAACMATVAEHRARNNHLADAPDKATFQTRRDARDATLPLPKLMLAALQINIRGGQPPDRRVSRPAYGVTSGFASRPAGPSTRRHNARPCRTESALRQGGWVRTERIERQEANRALSLMRLNACSKVPQCRR